MSRRSGYVLPALALLFLFSAEAASAAGYDRPETPANEISRQFDLVTFLDGQERDGTAVAADLEAFRRSWRWPKWHVLVQNTPLAGD